MADNQAATAPEWAHMPLDDFLDVCRFAVVDAQPFGSPLDTEKFTLTKADIRLNRQDGVVLEHRLVFDAGGAHNEDHTKIGRRKVSVEEAHDKYREIVELIGKEASNLWLLDHWRSTVTKQIRIGALATRVEVSFGISFSNARPRFVGEITLRRGITPKVFVMQMARAIKTSRYGQPESELKPTSWHEAVWGQRAVALPGNWQKLMQAELGLRLPFTDLTADDCWDLLEWKLDETDVVEASTGERFIRTHNKTP